MTTATTTPSNGARSAPPVSRFVRARDLALDHEFWTNPRTTTSLDDKSIAEFAADIRLRGVQVPLIVQQVRATGGGITHLVIEGQRRTLAAMSIDPLMLLPVIDRTIEPIELTWEVSDKILLDMLAVGTQREGLSDFELSEVAERMRNRGKPLAEIGAAIKRSESWCSKILTARASATDKALVQWRKGTITTEAFKDLAAEKNHDTQRAQVDKVVEASKTGNKAEARVIAKETAVAAKERDKADAPKVKPAPVVKGPQEPLFKDQAPKAEPPKPPKKARPSPLALEELVNMAAKRPPTADLVRGIVLGVKYALGDIDPSEFGKAWNAYVNRVSGAVSRKPTKKSVRPISAGLRGLAPRKAAPRKAAKAKKSKKGTK